jgi:hypothetical protein
MIIWQYRANIIGRMRKIQLYKSFYSHIFSYLFEWQLFYFYKQEHFIIIQKVKITSTINIKKEPWIIFEYICEPKSSNNSMDEMIQITK